MMMVVAVEPPKFRSKQGEREREKEHSACTLGVDTLKGNQVWLYCNLLFNSYFRILATIQMYLAIL